jgi:hypothetical protein
MMATGSANTYGEIGQGIALNQAAQVNIIPFFS